MAASVVPPAGAGDLVAGVALLRVVVAAYPARFKCASRAHRARHADPRTTMGYDRARQDLDRHPN